MLSNSVNPRTIFVFALKVNSYFLSDRALGQAQYSGSRARFFC
jgi:hypothetical protein